MPAHQGGEVFRNARDGGRGRMLALLQAWCKPVPAVQRGLRLQPRCGGRGPAAAVAGGAAAPRRLSRAKSMARARRATGLPRGPAFSACASSSPKASSAFTEATWSAWSVFLPLQFAPGENAASLKLTAKKRFTSRAYREAGRIGKEARQSKSGRGGWQGPTAIRSGSARRHPAGSRILPQRRISAVRPSPVGRVTLAVLPSAPLLKQFLDFRRNLIRAFLPSKSARIIPCLSITNRCGKCTVRIRRRHLQIGHHHLTHIEQNRPGHMVFLHIRIDA